MSPLIWGYSVCKISYCCVILKHVFGPPHDLWLVDGQTFFSSIPYCKLDPDLVDVGLSSPGFSVEETAS